MPEVFPNVGLEYLLNTAPRKTQTFAATLWVGLFMSHTAASVLDPGGAYASIMEPTTGGYARQPLPAASWLTPASIASGMISTAAQVTFPETSAAYAPTGWASQYVNGYFIITTDTASGVVMSQANFDDGQPILVNSAGIVTRVTPAWKSTN